MLWRTTLSPHPRRWVQISLRGLLLLTVSVNLFVGALAYRARRQAAIIAEITRAGGRYFYSCDLAVVDGRYVVARTSPQQKAVSFTRGLFSDDWLYSVGFVSFEGTRPSREVLRMLRRLSGLKVLLFYHTGIEDADLEELQSCSGLDQLDLFSEHHISRDAARRLGNALPGCNISF